jgi:hypothetical protein
VAGEQQKRADSAELIDILEGLDVEACKECAEEHRQLAKWLRELKDLREVNNVLINECDRLIKEKGELLSKVSGGDVLRICQLEETIKRYESENYKLTQELEQLGTDFNNQVSLVGWHEEQEEKYKRLLGKAMKTLNDGSCNKDCRQCKWNGNCEFSCRFAWRYGDDVLELIGDETDEKP